MAVNHFRNLKDPVAKYRLGLYYAPVRPVGRSQKNLTRETRS